MAFNDELLSLEARIDQIRKKLLQSKKPYDLTVNQSLHAELQRLTARHLRLQLENAESEQKNLRLGCSTDH